LALCIFDVTLSRLWPENNELAGLLETEVSEKDYYVIAYVGGSVVKLLGKKANDPEYEACVAMLKCASDEAVHARWTATQDRGGLSYLHEKAFLIFKKAESVFKQIYNHEGTVQPDRPKFVEKCTEVLKEDFYSLTANVCSETTVKNVLHDLVNKFFTIRINHRGKALMQKLNRSKQKSLRKTLKHT